MTETPGSNVASVSLADVQTGVTSLRDTSKWTVGGLAAVAAAVIAGSPLTGLGSLDLGWRLALAVAGAAIGFAALGYVVWNSMDVMAARVLTFQGLVEGTALPCARQRRLEKRLAELFPAGTASFKEIGARRAHLEKEQATAQGARRKELENELEELRQRAERIFGAFNFEEVHDRFLMLRLRIFATAAVMILGFGIFAWAANPGKDRDRELAEPYIEKVTPKAEDLAGLGRSLTAACLQTPLPVLVVGESASGALDGVTIAPNCPPKRVVLRDKSTSVTLQH